MTGLHIRIVGINYAPEPTGIAPYTTDAAVALHRRGHHVTVVTGYPHYPAWSVDPRYGGRSILERIDGVEVHRVRHHVPQVSSAVGRLRMEAEFGVRAAAASRRPVDVTVAVSPALVASGLMLAANRFRRGAPVGVWVQDLYGVGARETGMVGARGARFAAATERTILRSADAVAVIHERFRGGLIDRYGMSPEKITTVPNWTHITAAAPSSTPGVRARLGWRDDETVLLHAGNMGVKQHLDNLVDVGREIDRRRVPVRIVLLGDGNQRAHLHRLADGVKSVEFLDPLADTPFAEALAAADVLLVNEKPGVRDMSVPSKLTSYFASGRPVLAAVDALSVTSKEIDRSGGGVCVPSGEPAAVLAAALSLAADPRRAEALGERGKIYSTRHLDRESGLDAFEAWVQRTAESRRRATPWR